MALGFGNRKVSIIGDSGKISLSGVVGMGAQLRLRRKYEVLQ